MKPSKSKNIYAVKIVDIFLGVALLFYMVHC